MSFSKIINYIKGIGQLSITDNGKGNSVIYPKTLNKRKFKIKIYGNNNKIVIKDNCYIHHVKLTIGFPDSPANNCYIEIGNYVNFNACKILLGEHGSRLIIKDNTMFSFGSEISCSDTHAILDNEGNLLNRGNSVEIGSNVWICRNVMIMKNSKIPDGCIVGFGAIVAKKFEEENCVIAGNPAKVVKSGIRWDGNRPNFYIKDSEENKKD